LAAAGALGLSRETAFAVLATTPIAAQAERRRSAVEAGEYPLRFALSLARKDAELLAAAAEDADLRIFDAARSWLADAQAAGRGDDDYSSVLAQILSENERASSRG
jgi:3-hydroxyisobutyrate dehydrogenase-like beta-hydroxyacid dehydrogenase